MYILDDHIRLHTKLDLPDGYVLNTDPSDPSGASVSVAYPEQSGCCSGEQIHMPLVIVIHGYTGHMEEPHIVAAARTFTELGCAALRVELYGHGDSDGEFADHTLFKWLGNVMAAIDYAKQLDFVSDIYLCGHSQGGLTVMLAAAMEADVIKGLIPMSPAIRIPDAARHGIVLGRHFDPEHVPDEIQMKEGRVLRGNYIRTAQTIFAEQIYPRYKGPVLLVHGDADETIPLEDSGRAAQLYEHAELAVIRGDTHCYDYHLDKVLEALRGWMQEMLQAAAEKDK